jgi:hypothetical protein
MDQDIDDALQTATGHAREAEERLIQKPPESPELVSEARTVEHRAEDIHVLAVDAVSDPDE